MEYVTRLDRGLDAIAYELARVSEASAGQAADAVLHVSATRFEIEGWCSGSTMPGTASATDSSPPDDWRRVPGGTSATITGSDDTG